MKKKYIIIAAILCVMIIAGCIAGAKIADHIKMRSTVEGRYLYTSNGSHMIISTNMGACTMSAEDKSVFDGLTDGDVISVVCGPVMETYPARMEVYKVKFVEDGSLEDIDKNTLASLAELGWYPKNYDAGASDAGKTEPEPHIIKIHDRAEAEGLPCAEAEEKFYEDESAEYFFSAIKSHYIIVTYSNGDSEDIITALSAERVSLADLDDFGIRYYTYPKK